MTIKRFGVACIASLALGACGTEELDSSTSEPVTSTQEQTLEVPADWIGHQLGLSAPRLRPVEKVTRFAQLQPGELPAIRKIEPQLGLEKPGGQIRTMGPDGTIYEVVVPEADLARVGFELRQRNLTGSSFPSEAPRSESGWSNGIDSRARSVNTASDWPRDTIGVVSPNGSSWCTGTLFEDRLVLTAFHCLWDGYGNWVGGAQFRAGQDGTTQPYAAVDHTWKYWDQGFVDNECHKWKVTGYRQVCEKYDWAVLVLGTTPRSSTGVAPGYMGVYYNSSDSGVSSYTKYHYGYPGCGSGGAPAGCVNNSMWGQSFACTTGSFFNSVNGWNRNFYHGCDMSGGHSGGPLYSWSPGSNGPYLLATNIAESCTGSDCTGTTPNIAFRIDQWLGDLMMYWRSIY
ncbi:trypsin-like serine peptidase [Hyalangium gracile]|uniref:trypsin-like serine peptidase n=1 Tax=Hyalangium gracile TaxID=394092 RepID=UPI001CC99C0D|nr:trypsin-like peptidase domain-containing protein [Hyalangium gracile]